MPDHLIVSPDGLRAGAARSEQLSAELTAASTTAPGKGSGSSAAGVSAVTAAIASARRSQASVVNGHVVALRGGAKGYDDTDRANARSTGGILL